MGDSRMIGIGIGSHEIIGIEGRGRMEDRIGRMGGKMGGKKDRMGGKTGRMGGRTGDKTDTTGGKTGKMDYVKTVDQEIPDRTNQAFRSWEQQQQHAERKTGHPSADDRH